LDASGEEARETWSSNFSIPGHAPVLIMPEYLIDDSGGNNNGLLDAGETASIRIAALNSGSSGAYNVTGDLTTESEYVKIVNSPLPYGSISADSSN
jgi:hypothetical protein